MNYFDFFGLPLSFTVDEAALRRIFLLNSKKYHPDFHTLADEAVQAEMLDRSTLNNEAFKTLSDLDSRIRYILEIKGLVGEEGKQQPLPQDFLLEMMDINEAIMDLEFDFDATRHTTALHALEALEKQIFEGVRPILASWSEATGQASELLAVRDYFFKKRYLLRVRENLSKFAPA